MVICEQCERNFTTRLGLLNHVRAIHLGIKRRCIYADGLTGVQRYQARHPDRCRASTARWKVAHPEAQHIYYLAHRAEILTRTTAYRLAHNEAYRQWNREWQQSHLTRKAHNQVQRRIRERGTIGSHTLAEWQARIKEFGGRCFYCGKQKQLTRDHNIPLTRGGTNFISNILPACRICNLRKRTKTAEEFIYESTYRSHDSPLWEKLVGS